MGIDKPDVKLVVHMELPSTIEAYFQESGRAGRNGKTAYAFLFANNTDIKRQEYLLQIKYPKTNEILETYQNIANYLQIAEGDFPKESIAFNIEEFSKKYNLRILKTYHILKYLEKEDYIKLENTKKTTSKAQIIISSQELYKFQITHKFYDAFIKIILRSYSNIFNHLVSINEEKIGSLLNKPTNDVKKILIKLKKLEIIEYKPQNNLPQLKFLQARKDTKRININKEKWKKRNEGERIKLNLMIQYIQHEKSCRRQILLKYFEKHQKNATYVISA